MLLKRELDAYFNDGPIDENDSSQEATSAHSLKHKGCIEDNHRVSIYSLQSSVKVESTTERGFITFLKGLIGTGILALPFCHQQSRFDPSLDLTICSRIP